ncbi:MAG: phosphopentomutase, partial [Clostridium sp.]|nr:phosphopentomutase [Clostridium sp.]
MGRFIIIVLDGFGVGEMPDVEKVRPADIGANTCAHIYERVPDLRLPALESLGLGRLMGKTSASGMDRDAACGRIALMHDGADTFFGHQEIMGTRPKKPFGEPIANKLEAIRGALAGGGFAVRDYARDGRGLLVVEEAVTVGDNI